MACSGRQYSKRGVLGLLPPGIDILNNPFLLGVTGVSEYLLAKRKGQRRRDVEEQEVSKSVEFEFIKRNTFLGRPD